MYANARRRGLGIDTGEAGAFDAADAAARGVVDANDADAVAAAIGVSPPPGYASITDAIVAAANNESAAIQLDPMFAAMMYGWYGMQTHAPVQDAIAEQLAWTPASVPGAFSAGPPTPAALRAFQSAVQTLWPKIWAIGQVFAPGENWNILDPDVAARVNRTEDPRIPESLVTPAASPSVVSPQVVTAPTVAPPVVQAPTTTPAPLYTAPVTVPAATSPTPIVVNPTPVLYQSPASNGPTPVNVTLTAPTPASSGVSGGVVLGVGALLAAAIMFSGGRRRSRAS